MTNFIKTLEYGGQVYEFSFARIVTIAGPKYFLMVVDSNREYHFIMERNKDGWMMNDAPKVPEWIHELEEHLVNIIVQNEAETNKLAD